MPKGGSGRQHCRKDARWVLPCLHLSEMLRCGLPPPRGTWPDPRRCGRFPSPPPIPESLDLGGGKIGVSSEVCQQGGRSPASPGSRSSGAGRSGRRCRTPRLATRPPGPGRPGELPRCPLDSRREGHPRPKYLRPPGRRRRRRRCYPHGSVRERNFLLGRPLRSPGVWGGGGERGAAPAGSSSSRRPVMLTPAPAPGARPPLPSLRRVAVTESPRLRRVRRSRAAAARSESPGEAPAHSSLSAGEAAAPGAREQPRLGRAEVRPAAGRRGGLLRAASARSQRLALAAAAGEAARPRGAGLRPGPRPLSP